MHTVLYPIFGSANSLGKESLNAESLVGRLFLRSFLGEKVDLGKSYTFVKAEGLPLFKGLIEDGLSN